MLVFAGEHNGIILKRREEYENFEGVKIVIILMERSA
jgi:hypothetical protein